MSTTTELKQAFDKWMHDRLFSTPPKSVTPFDAYCAGRSAAHGEPSKAEDENVEDLRKMLHDRAAVGIRKYGVTTSQSDLGLRDWLQHALEETLDNAVYMRAAMRKLDDVSSAEQVSEHELASILVAVANDDSIPKLDDDEIRTICQSRGWTLNDTPSLRELAHVFYAEGCAAQRRALQHTAPAPSNPAIEGAIRDALAHGTGIVRIDPLSIFQQDEQAAPSKAGEWTDEQIDEIWMRVRDSLPDTAKIPEFRRKFARALLSSAPAQAQAQSEDASLLDWLEAHPGFQLEKFITWRNGEDEYDGIERSYWQLTTNDDDEFKGGKLREAIRAAMSTQSEKP